MSAFLLYKKKKLTSFQIIILGFLTWDDLRANRLHWHKYRMQSKVILCTTVILLIIPAVYFFFEFTALEPGKVNLLTDSARIQSRGD